MNFCLKGKQKNDVLLNCDEIVVNYKDDNLLELAKNFDKIFIMNIPNEEVIDWDYIHNCNELCRDKLYLKLSNLFVVDECKAYKIKFFLDYYVKTIEEFNEVIDLGVSYIYLDSPLFFSINDLDFKQAILRINPIECHHGYFDFKNIESSAFVRPEDCHLYEPCTLEFISHSNLSRDKALFEVYKKETWPGTLRLLIPEIPEEVNNRLIDKKFGERRLNCHQDCLYGGKTRTCHYCTTAFKLASQKENLKDYKENIYKK